MLLLRDVLGSKYGHGGPLSRLKLSAFFDPSRKMRRRCLEEVTCALYHDLSRLCSQILLQLTDTQHGQLRTLLQINQEVTSAFLSVADSILDITTVIPFVNSLSGGRFGHSASQICSTHNPQVRLTTALPTELAALWKLRNSPVLAVFDLLS